MNDLRRMTQFQQHPISKILKPDGTEFVGGSEEPLMIQQQT